MTQLSATSQRWMLSGVTLSYCVFMLSDGALRMLVLLYFHQQGFSTLQLAALFLAYEFTGIVTNLVAAWIATKFSLDRVIKAGYALQIISVGSLILLNDQWSTSSQLLLVMCAQGGAGIAKDLCKTGAKTAVKRLSTSDQGGGLFRVVALVTGSKNAVKGLGFFLGAALLAFFDLANAAIVIIAVLVFGLLAIILAKLARLGIADTEVKAKSIVAPPPEVKSLSLARLYLFASRDTWLVIALPVLFSEAIVSQGFSSAHAYYYVGGFFAAWTIMYGYVQAKAPKWLAASKEMTDNEVTSLAQRWAWYLAGLTSCIALLALLLRGIPGWQVTLMTAALMLFGVLFAINSSLHSFFILRLTHNKRAAMDIGFYYMSNAMGRFLGTLLSGLVFYYFGFAACLFVAAMLLVLSAMQVATVFASKPAAN